MDDSRHDTGPELRRLHELWICPRCEARLVSRNLWHSCGRFTLEDLFAGAAPDTLDLAPEYEAELWTYLERAAQFMVNSPD